MNNDNKGFSVNGYTHEVGDKVEYNGKTYVIEDARHPFFFSLKDNNSSYLVLRSDIDGRMHKNDPIRRFDLLTGRWVSLLDHPFFAELTNVKVNA